MENNNLPDHIDSDHNFCFFSYQLNNNKSNLNNKSNNVTND